MPYRIFTVVLNIGIFCQYDDERCRFLMEYFFETYKQKENTVVGDTGFGRDPNVVVNAKVLSGEF